MTTSSSRNPWSGLFGASGVRQFVQDVFNQEGHPVRALDPVTAREDPEAREDKSSTEILPVPPKASLSFFSTLSGGSVGTRRSPLVLGYERAGLLEDAEEGVVFEDEEDARSLPLFDHHLVEQFKAHVNIYAEIFHWWEMDHQRLELLKAISENVVLEEVSLGVTQTCPVCLMPTDKSTCATCESHIGALLCSVCCLSKGY
ncbi:hypothetical protein JOM56_005678 [Amanita muscaria]